MVSTLFLVWYRVRVVWECRMGSQYYRPCRTCTFSVTRLSGGYRM
jgi:hypothetical protein